MYVNPEISKHLNPISGICQKCQGKHWQPKDPSASQSAVFKEYGLIPSDCVPESTGITHCPFANQK